MGQDHPGGGVGKGGGEGTAWWWRKRQHLQTQICKFQPFILRAFKARSDKVKVNSDVMIESSRQNLRKSCLSHTFTLGVKQLKIKSGILVCL